MGIEVIDAGDVIKRMGLNDNPDTRESIESNLSGAQKFYEGLLASLFDKGAGSDIFNPKIDFFWDTLPGNIFKLRLRSGFVRASPALTVVYAESLADLATGTDITAETYLDAVRGIVTLPFGDNEVPTYNDKWLKVTYEYGFEKDANGAYVGEEPPDWLFEAIISYIPGLQNVQQTTKRAAEAKKLAELSVEHGMQVVAPYLRKNIPFAYSPVI